MAGSQYPRSLGARNEIAILIAALEGLPGRSWSPQSQNHRTRQWSMEGRGETPQPHSPSPSFLPLMPPICQAQPEARGRGEPEECSPQKGSAPEGIEQGRGEWRWGLDRVTRHQPAPCTSQVHVMSICFPDHQSSLSIHSHLQKALLSVLCIPVSREKCGMQRWMRYHLLALEEFRAEWGDPTVIIQCPHCTQLDNLVVLYYGKDT